VSLRRQGVSIAFVTLDIGLDTFRPVQAELVTEHRIHTERCTLTPQVARQINKARLGGQRVIAVGTTTVRVLETAALRAATCEISNGSRCAFQCVRAFSGTTDLFIYPGFRFRAVDALITNFHLPRSSLLMLVSAFAGRERVLQAYQTAIDMGYRFYSFGDAMLIL